ncbi:MAG: tetratricopeptide repeat protein, partial [Myxococcales bacterium]|nr:tetratricopeptide repeat protein [Myxococcales bacterium]
TLGERIAAAPDDADLRLRRAELRRRQGHPKDALADLRVAARLRPDARVVWLQQALALSELGRAREAERLLDRFLAAGPPTADALAERARLREADERLELARADLDAAIAVRPTPELVLARGRLDERRGRLDDAAAGYREGLRALGPAVVVQLALVDADRRRGAPEAALALLDDLLRTGSPRADWILMRAEILDELGLPAAATVERLRALLEAHAAVRHRPTPLHQLTLAQAHLALDQVHQAREVLDRVLRDAPTLAAARALHARLEALPEIP